MWLWRNTALFAVLALATVSATAACAAKGQIELRRDDGNGRLAILLDGAEVWVYQYADSLDTPHFWPLRSPSGKLLTVQHPPLEKYPHHRSFWIADRVELAGRNEVDFYTSWKNQPKPHAPDSPFTNWIRHREFTLTETEDDRARIGMKLIWEIDRKVPVLDQTCVLTFWSQSEGAYLADLSFTLTASYGDVRFLSDWVHYAWPYVRMHPQFSGDQGGTIIDDQGRTGQKQTNGKYARWIDYSNTVDGVTEGLALFSHPSNGRHKWLTREYGTWGPRRVDELSGTKFTLKKGDHLTGRVGVYVHRGDAKTGRVAEKYQTYLNMSQPTRATDK